jgi:hypothetical protein
VKVVLATGSRRSSTAKGGSRSQKGSGYILIFKYIHMIDMPKSFAATWDGTGTLTTHCTVHNGNYHYNFKLYLLELPAMMKVHGEEAVTLALWLNTTIRRKKLSFIRTSVGSDGRPCKRLHCVPVADVEAIGQHHPVRNGDPVVEHCKNNLIKIKVSNKIKFILPLNIIL